MQLFGTERTILGRFCAVCAIFCADSVHYGVDFIPIVRILGVKLCTEEC